MVNNLEDLSDSPLIFSPAQKEVSVYGLGEVKDVTINSKAIIPILADKIYKDPLSAIRELYNNEVTACKKTLQQNPEATPHIVINFITASRELRIKGIDSLGIDLETFDKIVTVMGNSGNNEGDQIGYFGLGFYSFVKLSERCIINSYSRKTKEKFAYICKSAVSFEQLPKDTYTELNEYGCEIILSVKDEINNNEITNKINQVARLSGIKTDLFVDSDQLPIKQYDKLEQYFKDSFYDYFNKPYANYSLNYDHIDNEDFELFIGEFNKVGYDNAVKPINEAYLLNTPISLDLSNRGNSSTISFYLLNMKNERMYKPKPDREQLEKQSEDQILKVFQKWSKDIPEKTFTNLDQWYADKDRFNYSPKQLSNIQAKSVYYMYHDKCEKRSISHHLPTEKPKVSLISKSLRKETFFKLKMDNIFCIAVNDKEDYEQLTDFGFIDINTYLRKNKNKSVYVTKPTEKFVFHGKYRNHDKIDPDDFVFKVDNVKDRSPLFAVDDFYQHIFIISKNAKYEKAYELSDIPKLIHNYIFLTNKGFMTVKEIMKQKEVKEPHVFFEHDHDYFYLPEFLNEIHEFLIYGSSIETDLLKMYLEYKNNSSVGRKTYWYFERFLKKNLKNKNLLEILDKIRTTDINYDLFKNFMRLDKLDN